MSFLKITYKYLGFSETNKAKLENGKIIVLDLPKHFTTPNDKYYILENNVFKAYNPEKDGYDNYILKK